MSENIYDFLEENPHQKKKEEIRENENSNSLDSIRSDMKALLSSSRKFFKTKPKDTPTKSKPLPKPKMPKKTSAMGRTVGFLNSMVQMSADAIVDGQVDHKKYSGLVQHDKKKKSTPSKPSTPTPSTPKATPTSPTQPDKEKSNRGRPKGSKNKSNEEKVNKTPSDKKHDEEQTKKIETKVEKSSETTNTTVRAEVSRLIKSNEDMEKARITREDRLRRRAIDWSPDQAKATVAKPKQVKPQAKEEMTKASPSGGVDLPSLGGPSMIGGALSKVAGGAKALGASAMGTLGSSVGTVGAGTLGASVAGSAVAGLAIGNYLTESGVLGEDMAKGYSVGDLMSSWFGEGTRNLKRHIDIEKKKILIDADKSFRVMSNKFKPWKGVSKERMAEIRRNPGKYGQKIEAYYRLWMREEENRAVSNVMSSHEDGKNMGKDAIAHADELFKLALSDRVAFMNKHFKKPQATNEEKKQQAEQKKALESESKQLDTIAVSEGKSSPTGVKTTNVSVAKGGSATGNASQNNVKISGSSTTNVGGSKASLNSPKVSGVISGDNGTQAQVNSKGKGSSFDSVVGERNKSDMESLKSFLLNQFAPAVAKHIVAQSEEKRKETSRRAPRTTRQNNMGSPEIFR